MGLRGSLGSTQPVWLSVVIGEKTSVGGVQVPSAAPPAAPALPALPDAPALLPPTPALPPPEIPALPPPLEVEPPAPPDGLPLPPPLPPVAGFESELPHPVIDKITAKPKTVLE